MVSFDQDSVPPPDLVSRLARTLHELRDRGERVAAVGPAKADPRTGLAGRLLRPIRFLRRHVPGTSPGPVEVDHVITSGCLIPSDMFREVGPYDEALFLEYVDMEWCQRARSLGLRTYLLLRNHLLLWRKKEIRRFWLASDFLQVLKKLAATLVLAPRRGERLRWMARGLADGLRGRGGPP